MSSPQKAYSRCHKGLTLFSDEPHPKVWFTFHYRNPSRRIPEPFVHRSWGTHPQLNWGLPNLAEASQVEVFTAPPPSRVHNVPKRHKALGNPMHPRVTSFSTLIFTYHRRESNPMQLMQKGKTTQSGQILHSQIPTKQQMLWGE